MSEQIFMRDMFHDRKTIDETVLHQMRLLLSTQVR